MARKITINSLKNVESELRQYEEIKFMIQQVAKQFLKTMKKTNQQLLKSGENSIGYVNVFSILKKRTKLFSKKNVDDYSCFYDTKLIRDIISQVVESKKLKAMELKILKINDLLLKAESLRNSMREKIENCNCCDETEELLDLIESLSLEKEITIISLFDKIEEIKHKKIKEDMIA